MRLPHVTHQDSNAQELDGAVAFNCWVITGGVVHPDDHVEGAPYPRERNIDVA